MAMNALGPRSVRRVARETWLRNIVRATVCSHGDYWVVWITLDPHQHAGYDRLTGKVHLYPAGRSEVCTSLCRELFPDGT